MKITEVSIKYPIATFMVYLSTLLLGLVAIYKIPLEFLPKMDAPFVNIIVNYPEASPSEACETVAKKIEEAISTMHGIEKLDTHCRQGSAEIGVQLNDKAKTDYLVIEVKERIDAIKDELPADLPPILAFKFDTDQLPIIFASIGVPENVDLHYSDLLDQFIVRPLKTVDGVADVQFFGMEEKRVKIELNQDLMDSFGVSALEVYGKLAANNLNFSIGEIKHNQKNYAVRVKGEFNNLNEIRDLQIRNNIRLSDIANVDYEYVRPDFRGRVNGKPAYLMLIQKESGANTVAVSREIAAKIDQILKNPQLAGVEIKTWFNQADEIETAVSGLKSSGIMGAVFAFLVLWFFLKDFRPTLIISLSIPTSLLMTIFAMYFLHYSFNVITLSGLVMGIGMLVDNSIVVMEAIYKRIERGHSRAEAAVLGTGDVGLAISASSTTTMIVFLPLIFSQHKEVSVLMGQMGIVTILAIFASLLVSLTLIPLLASMLITGEKEYKVKWFQWVEDRMVNGLKYSLARRARVLVPLFIVFVVTISFFFMPKVIEKESLPKAMMHILQIRLKYEQKPDDREMEERFMALEKLFMAHKDEWELEAVNTVIMPQFTRVSLVTRRDPPPTFQIDELEDRVKAMLKKEVNWPGVSFDFSTMDMAGGPEGGPSPTTIKVKGDDADQVYFFAEEIRQRLQGLKTVKEVGELEKEGQREVHIEVDRELAKKYGFDASTVAFTIEYMIRGVSVGKFNTADRQIDLYFQLQEADRKTLQQLKNMNLQNPEGKAVPLKNIARFVIKGVPEGMKRENRRATVRIPIFPKVRDLGEVRDEAMARLADFHLPKGYIWVMGEEYQDMLNMIYDMLKSVLLATILVFIIMTAQFESFLLPFVVMFEIPLAAIGVSLFLAATRSSFNILSGAGCLLLIGVVVNNAIVLVDHVNNLRRQGVNDRDSLIQGAHDRMRPIAMTSLTTIIGLVPMAVGLNDTGRMVYSPLAIAVMGGMIVSTFFTPIIIPIIFSLTDSVRDAFKDLGAYLKKV